MQIDTMGLGELCELRTAIRAEVARRIKALKAIAKHDGRARNGGHARYDAEEFVKAAQAGMTMLEAAQHIGCNRSRVWQVAEQLGLKFAPGKAGRPRKS